MSPKQILIVAIRLVVLIGIVQTLGSIATIFVQAESMYDSKQISSVLMLYGLYLIAWLLLWCFPATIANRLLPEHLQTVQEAPKHPAPWLTTGIVLIGIYTVFPSYPRPNLPVLSLSFCTVYCYRHTYIRLGGPRRTKPSRYTCQHRAAFYRHFPAIRRTKTLVLDTQKTLTTGRLKPSDGLPHIHSHAQTLT